jgi:hypothetical protein
VSPIGAARLKHRRSGRTFEFFNRIGSSPIQTLARRDLSHVPWQEHAEAVRAKVQALADAAARTRRQCDGDFYLAVFRLQKYAEADARPLWQAAAAGRAPESMEARFAKAELKRRGS